MNKKVVVFGGTGILGSALVDTLLKKSEFIVSVLSRKISPNTQFIRYYQGDILNSESITQAVRENDIIINCTGQITKPIGQCLQANTLGMLNLARLVEKYHKFILHVSTVNVYGSAENVDENSPMQPETVYAALKACSENIVTSLIPSERYCIVRLSNLYGSLKSKGILSLLLSSIATNKTINIDNDGSLLRFFLHVNDAASILATLLANNIHGIVNLPGNEMFTIRSLVEIIEKHAKKKIPVVYENRQPHSNIRAIDCNNIAAHGKLEYQYSVESYILSIFG